MFNVSRFLVASGMAVALSAGAVALPGVAYAKDDAATEQKQEQVNVVYHINDSEGQALGALRNMRNHLDVAPDTKIVAVAHADGIQFLMNDYKDADTVGPLVAGLTSRGVTFEVCEITMQRNDLTPDDFLMEASFTPSGVARLGELQALEGYAYIKP